MNFAAGAFLLGLVAAAGPILIHLMNRRRYRVVQWAAMDFLAGAVKKNRRVLELRDMLLLILRILALVLFTLAMARPYCSEQLSVWDQKGPSHVILVIDNSMSMNYRALNESRFEKNQQAAIEMLDSLPAGSAVSIIPTCAVDEGLWRDDFLNLQDAMTAIEAMQPVDASSRVQVSLEKVTAAMKRLTDLPDKRVVWLGDLNHQDWDQEALIKDLEEVGEMRVFYDPDQKFNNTWVADLSVMNGMTDTQAEAVLTAILRHESDQPREGLGVKLEIDGRIIEERQVDLEPGQSLELNFQHRFEEAGSSDEPRYAHVKVSLDSDQLPEDDQRHLLVPVMTRVPVVFIDELGAQNENTRANLFGETYPLRRLRRPMVKELQGQAQLVEVRHYTADQVDQKNLEEARLVVIGGVREPSWHLVKLLREYVQQGGQLLIITGETFSPEAWNRQAWQEAQGILPAMLKETPIGKVPRDEDDVAQAFRLNPDQVYASVFQFPFTEKQLKSLYLSPLFFKAIGIDETSLNQVSQLDRERIEKDRAWVEEFRKNEERWAKLEADDELEEADAYQREVDQTRMREMHPNWLKWRHAREETEDMELDDLVLHMKPQVMARYDNGEIFGVSRNYGQGQVVMITTGMRMRWNTLRVGDGILLMDQLMKEMISVSLPQRNLIDAQQWELSVEPADQDAHFVLQTPEQLLIPMTIEAMGRDEFGLRFNTLSKRGVYEIWCLDEAYDAEKELSAHKVRYRKQFTVNGQADEGDLRPLEDERWESLSASSSIKREVAGDGINLDATSLTGGRYWKWLMMLALAILLGEHVLLYLASKRSAS